MRRNLGFNDKVTRLVLAMVIGILFMTNIVSGLTAIVLIGVAILLFLTSAISFCPVYALFGLSSRKKEMQAEVVRK